jgi:hypothetical protein
MLKSRILLNKVEKRNINLFESSANLINRFIVPILWDQENLIMKLNFIDYRFCLIIQQVYHNDTLFPTFAPLVLVTSDCNFPVALPQLIIILSALLNLDIYVK